MPLSAALKRTRQSFAPLALFLFILLPVSALAQALDAYLETEVNKILLEVRLGEIRVPDFAEQVLELGLRGDEYADYVASQEFALPGIAQSFSEKIEEHLQRALEVGNEKAVQRLAVMAKGQLPQGSEILVNLSSLAAVSRALTAAGEANDFSLLAEPLREIKSDAQWKLAAPKVETFIDANVQAAANNKGAVATLSSIAAVQTFSKQVSLKEPIISLLSQAAARARQGEAAKGQWKLDRPEVQDALRAFAQEDTSIANDVAALYATRASLLMADGELARAKLAYQALLEWRPDPSVENDAVRLKLVMAARGSEAEAFASELLETLEGSEVLGRFTRIRLLWKGHYGSGVAWIMRGALLLLLLLLLILAVRSPILLASFAARADSARPRRKKKGKGYQDVTDSDDEYTQLLAVFGLDDGASESEIKRAFRKAVKEHHPDMQGGRRRRPR